MFREAGEVFVGEMNVEVFGIELDAHQEEAGCFVGVFISVQDVAAMAVDEIGDGRDFAFRVRAGDQEDGGGFHGFLRRRARLSWTTLLVREMSKAKIVAACISDIAYG